jgi:hypothetical protein
MGLSTHLIKSKIKNEWNCICISWHFIVISAAAFGGLWLPSQPSSSLLCPLRFLSSPNPHHHKDRHCIVQPSRTVRSRPFLLLEKKLPFSILLSIHSPDILSSCPNHLILCAFTNRTMSCPLISSFTSAL